MRLPTAVLPVPTSSARCWRSCFARRPLPIAMFSARALLMASDGFANTRIAKKVGVSPATVIAWRERFEAEGLKASVVVRRGRGRKPSIPAEKVEEIVAATLHETPEGET